MLKYGVNLQYSVVNIGNRLFSGTVWLSISYCNQVKSSS